ncbi:MAG: L-threonylcarbamoyladenylate synthase [Ruminococcus sp.]
METKLLRDTTEDIATAAKIINEGGIVAMPTETVYGLGANALDGNAVSKIFKAKGRPMDNPLIVHVSSVKMAEDLHLYREFTKEAKALAEKFWPGPLTIILPKGDCIPHEVSAGLPTVAVRCPSHKVAQKLIALSGKPLAAPSANISGKPSPTKFQHCVNDLMGKADAIIDGGECSVGVESTVVTLATNPPRLLRPGGVTVEQLESVLGKVDIDDAVLDKLKENEVASSPGMKYKHYAPSAQVYLVKGKEFVSFVNRVSDSTTAVVCFDEDKSSIKSITYPIGSRDDYFSHAHKIFDVLRQIDKDENIKKVFAPLPRVEGVSLAVYNRLIRASAFRIINADAYVVGLTGPTGAGKSTVARVFEENGYHIVDTDKIARTILEKGSPLLPRIAKAFGEDVINSEGCLNRKLLAKRAFETREKTDLLNSITHPYIYEKSLLEIEEYSNKGYDKFILDAPVLFESGGEKYCKKTVAVISDLEKRIERITLRDNLTEKEAIMRIKAQHSDDYYIDRADFVLNNNSGQKELEEKTISLINGEL